MVWTFTQLLLASLAIYFGAEWLVSGSSRLALSFRIPSLIVGLTVVAFGTSAPEMIVGIQAAQGGHGEIALGNVLGSNIANLGLVLGLCALIQPARVDGSLRRREVPVLGLSALLLWPLASDGLLSWLESALLAILALGYTAWMVIAARRKGNEDTVRLSIDAASSQATAAEIAVGETEPSGFAKTRAFQTLLTAVGLGVLLAGGSAFVNAASSLARTLGMQERLVGLTIVALGTSLPEIVTSLVASAKGSSDLAVGNVVGSNIFNALLCLGAAGLAKPLQFDAHAVQGDLFATLVFTLLGCLFLRTERTVQRWEGGLLVLLYVGYMARTIAG